MDSDSELEVGIVGAGHITAYHHLPLLANIDTVDLGYIADIDGERTRNLCRHYGADPVEIEPGSTALPQSDIALIAVPVGVRGPYIEEYGRRGTPTFVEKPFAPDRETHREFCSQTGQISANYMRQQFETVRTLEGIAESELLGRPESVTVQESKGTTGTGKSKNVYQTDLELSGGGVLIESGCHTLSQITHVLDGYDFDLKETAAEWIDGLEVDVTVDLVAESGGHTCDISYRLTMLESMENRATFEFENGTVTFDHTDPGDEIRITSEGVLSDGVGDLTLTAEGRYAKTVREAFYLAWESFLRTVSGEREFDTSSSTGWEVTSIIDQVYDELRD